VRSAALELNPDVAFIAAENTSRYSTADPAGERTSSRRTPDEADQPGQCRRRNGAHRQPAQPLTSKLLH